MTYFILFKILFNFIVFLLPHTNIISYSNIKLKYNLNNENEFTRKYVQNKYINIFFQYYFYPLLRKITIPSNLSIESINYKINTKELFFSIINLSHITTHTHVQQKNLSRFSHVSYVKGRSKEKKRKKKKSKVVDWWYARYSSILARKLSRHSNASFDPSLTSSFSIEQTAQRAFPIPLLPRWRFFSFHRRVDVLAH